MSTPLLYGLTSYFLSGWTPFWPRRTLLLETGSSVLHVPPLCVDIQVSWFNLPMVFFPSPLLPPSLHPSVWTEESICTVLNSTVIAEMNCSYSCGVDCRGVARYPCLQVFVRINASGRIARLSQNEDSQELSSQVTGNPHLACRTPRLHLAYWLYSSNSVCYRDIFTALLFKKNLITTESPSNQSFAKIHNQYAQQVARRDYIKRTWILIISIISMNYKSVVTEKHWILLLRIICLELLTVDNNSLISLNNYRINYGNDTTKRHIQHP